MTFEYMLKERERKGIEQGRAEGHAAGLSEGRSEGEAIGLKKGAAQKQREIAKVMKEKNISNTEISEITGLSVEEVDKL